MPEDFKLRRAWLSSLIKKTDTKIPKYLYEDVTNPVDQFKDLIEKNSSIYMLANGMFEEVPTKAPYDRDPTTLKKQVRNYKTMLYLFNTLLTKVPEWFGGGDSDIPNGLVGFPYNIIVDWPMGTESGRQFFLDPRVNNCLKDILNAWGNFLKDPTAGGSGPSGGNQALIDAGWTKKEAIEQLENKANEATGTDLPFEKLFVFPDGGDASNFFNYACWDDFFIRKFQDGIRPLADSAVVNACESFPLAFDTDVSRRNTFWLKGTPYSLYDMLGAPLSGDDEYAQTVDKFVGGAVYQAFLSADSYHCWNAPVTGEVVHRDVLEGTYYAETAAAGFGGSDGPDPAGPDVSQRYITNIATRGILIIDTKDHEDIGLVAFVPVGMSEVSTCEWEEEATAKGKTVQKGDLIGAFHGGGSTHCLVFEREAMKKLKFNPKAEYPEVATVNLAVKSELASL